MDRTEQSDPTPEQGRSAAVDVGADLSEGRRPAPDGDDPDPSAGFLGDGDTDDS